MNTHYLKFLLLISALAPQNSAAMESQAVTYSYLIKEEHAHQCDDRKREIFVKTPLFMALCVNAAHDTGRSKQNFEKLLAEVQKQTISVSNEEATLTQKEFFAGLIAHVKYAHECIEGPNGPLLAVLINGQETYLQFGPNIWNPNNIKALKYENMPAEDLAALTLHNKLTLSKYAAQS